MALLVGVLAVVASLPSAAAAADRVYWTDGGSGAIRVGNLDGSGSAANLFTGETNPQGVAIDPAAGKIYWADYTNSGAIRVANLDGSGAPSNLFAGEGYPAGVTIDPAAGKIYWADDGSTVRVGNLNGSGSAATLFSSETSPWGVAIDPGAGKLYWGQYAGPAGIRVGNLNGSGSAATVFSGQNNPLTVAIDAAAGKMYWGVRSSPGGVRVGNLNGSGSYADLFASETDSAGVAIDPTAGKVYWTYDTSSGAIRVGSLSGGAASNLGSFTGEDYPNFLALLRAPVGTGAPEIAGGSIAGSVLSCSPGSWALDLLGGFLYRAPRSFGYQWSVNGTDIPGATGASYVVSGPGSYTCRETATNQAGGSAQTSGPHTVGSAPVGATKATVSALSETNSVFAVARSSTPLTAQAAATHHKKGTIFFFRLDQPATVKIAIQIQAPGRRVGRACKPNSRRLRHKRRCTRTVTIATLTRSGHTGLNKVAFSGRIRGRALKPGRYQAAFTAIDAAGASPSRRLSFKIVKR